MNPLLLTVLLIAWTGCEFSIPRHNAPYAPPDNQAASDGSMSMAGGDLSDLYCSPATVPCGRCGTKSDLCRDGVLVRGTCLGEGPCAPGESYDTLSGCMVRICKADCQWDIFRFKPGNVCETGTSRGCDAGIGCSHQGTQRCVACKWGSCVC